jgi:hypothetical protein
MGFFVKIMLDKLNKIIDNLENIRQIQNEVVSNVLSGKENEITNLQTTQFFNGKSSKNQDLRPYYSEDSYFKTIESAHKYIAWKERITPNAKRNPDAPNLYINGYFYSKINSEVNFSNLTIRTEGLFADKIAKKYDNLLGLNFESLEYIKNKYAKIIKQRMIQKIYGN